MPTPGASTFDPAVVGAAVGERGQRVVGDIGCAQGVAGADGQHPGADRGVGCDADQLEAACPVDPTAGVDVGHVGTAPVAVEVQQALDLAVEGQVGPWTTCSSPGTGAMPVSMTATPRWRRASRGRR